MGTPPEINSPPSRLPPAAPSPPLPWGEHVHIATLANRLTVWVQQHPYPPAHVASGLWVAVGSLGEDEGELGYAHFLEHMAFSGTRRFSPGEIERFFAALGTALGHHHNASTTMEFTRYNLTLPTSDPRVLRRALELLADIAFGIALDPREIERQRGIILEELRARMDRTARAQQALLAALVPGSLVAARHPLGTAATVRALTRPRLASFYRRWYRPELALLAVVGEVEVEQVLDLAREIFAPWQGSGAPPTPPDPGVSATGELRALALRSADVTHLQASHRVVHPNPPPQCEAELATRWAARLAWWMLNRRLANALADGQLPGEDARASSSPLVAGWAVSRAVIVSPRRGATELLQPLLVELHRARHHGFHPAEVAAGRAALLAALRRGSQEYPTRPAPAVLSDLLDTAARGKPPLSPAQRLALAHKLLPQVDGGTALAEFRAALPAQAGVLVALVPARRGIPTPKATDLLAAHGRAAATPTSPAFQLPATGLPIPALTPARVTARKHHWDGEVITLRLEDRTIVHLLPTRQRPGQVFLTLTLPGGRIREREGCLGITYAALLAAQRLTVAGVASSVIRDVLSCHSIALMATADEDCVTVSCTTNRKDLEVTLELLRLLLTSARLDRAALDFWRQGTREVEQRNLSDLQAQLGQAAAALLSGGDPRFRLLTAADARALSWRRVQRWLEEEILGASVEAAIVGDVEAPAAEELAARFLGSLPARPDRHAEIDPLRSLPSAPSFPTATVRVPTSEERAALLIGWRTPPWGERRTRHLLKIGESILARRLTTELRERRALTYAVDCSLSPSKAYPAFSLLAAACLLPPSRLAEAEAVIGATVAHLLDAPPSEEEFTSAQTYLVRAARRTAEDPRRLAHLLAETAYRGVDVAKLAHLDEDYRRATLEEVWGALRAACTPAGTLTVRVTPG